MCKTCDFIGETYRYIEDTQAIRDAAYLRSVNAFWCPLCQAGFQRVIIATMTMPYQDWQYQCDNPECEMIGTRTEIETMAAPIEFMFGELCFAE